MPDNSGRINGRDLLSLGYPSDDLLGLALRINEKRHGFNRLEMLGHYEAVLARPEDYLQKKPFDQLARTIMERRNTPKTQPSWPLTKAPGEYSTYGGEFIEDGARQQMAMAMRLPISVAGALMPDAHQGYGLPVGGVLATENALIPYGVGVDIGCRMCLSVFDLPPGHLNQHSHVFRNALMQNTLFGAGKGFTGSDRSDHEVLENPLFESTRFLHGLLDKAWTQLGSSGGGNHFVEWGLVEVPEESSWGGIRPGTYVALLSHSGSRGLGATIANHYTAVAKQLCPLPREAQNLAFLDLGSEAGQEYWEAMNLAGDYASACHEIIHEKIRHQTGFDLLTRVENHHNFAWKEVIGDRSVIVHRKGATPAGEGVLGVIPGSMTAPGFIVRGKGHSGSLESAAHGAGRQMSRTAAIRDIHPSQLEKALKEHGVELIGAGMDEAPQAYKDIHQVMAAQSALVDTLGIFYPRMVRMADDGSRED